MPDRIQLQGIEVRARHGVLEQEKQHPQLFLIDVVAHLDLIKAGATDSLGDTLDYSALASEITKVVEGERHDLIERVATRVAETVLDHHQVEKVVVTVHKPEAPVDVTLADISVTIERHR